MTINDGVYIRDTWEDLKQNPVFRRSMLPRGIRVIWRSPIVRAVLLSLVAMGLFRVAESILNLSYIFYGLSAALLWTLLYAVQHYLCWAELMSMASTGTLADYYNSGLTRTDVAMGIIYPAKVSENIAAILIIGYFILTADKTQQIILMLLVAILIMRVIALFSPPLLFLPDAENYLRKRNPVALFLISFSIFVPMLVWFTIYFALFRVAAFVGVMMKLRDFQVISVGAFIATMYLSGWPTRKFQQWRLDRFYKRQGSFDELFERYVEGG
ncbi:hypothetical protein IT570_00925 [Candidatus Sumerlaeota bacterium]|nr:hypothetical protein [Candidatus Sumerlaeota bacterium]